MMAGKVTIRGVPIEFLPPTTDPDEKLVLGVDQSVIDGANRRMAGSGWRFVETRRAGDIPVYELKQDCPDE